MKPEEILRELYAQNFFDDEQVELSTFAGGTVSQVYLVKRQDSPPLVLKANDPVSNEIEVSFLKQYADCSILPRVCFTDNEFRFFLQSYVAGSTAYIPGRKKQQLLTLTEELLNKYTPIANNKRFGFEDELRSTWGEFLHELVSEAKQMAQGVMTEKDYQIVLRALSKISEPEQVYRIHGDCGAHNFILVASGELKGIIDPMPIFGDPLYDLLFAFCSTPDDLSRETLAPAINKLRISPGPTDNSDTLLIVSLYIRVSRAIKHQPDDVQAYREAWTSWTRGVFD